MNIGTKTTPSGSGSTPRPAPLRLHAALLILILAVGLWLRWMYLREILFTPEFNHPLIDPLFNDYWARGMVTGDWYSKLVLRAYGFLPDIPHMPYFKAPGYAYFLAVVYRLFGPSYLAPRLVQMVMGLLSAFMAFRLGRALHGRYVGLVFAGLMSVYWGFIYFEQELAEVAVLTLLIILFTYLLYRCARFRASPNALAAGIALGFASLMRPNVLLLLCAALGWGWWLVRRRRGMSWFGSFAASLVLASVLVVAPVTLRNYAVSGAFVPISTNMGVNLYIGNNASATGIFSADSPELSGYGSCFDYPRTVARLESRLGRRFTYPEVSSYYTNMALRFMVTNPASWLRLTLRKAYLLLGPHEITLNSVVHYDRLSSKTLSRIPLNFPAVLSLGVVGMVLVARRRRGDVGCTEDRVTEEAAAREASFLPPVLLVTYLVSLLPFFATSAYRMPVVPLLMLPGAYALCWVCSRLVARDLRRSLIWLALLVAVFVLASMRLVPYEPDLGKWHLDRATVRDLEGLNDEAVAEYRAAIAEKPDSAPLHYDLGIVLSRLGQFDDAADEFELALSLDPGMAPAHSALAHLQLREGRRRDAAESFRRAIQSNPRSSRDRADLAALLVQEGSFREAIALFEDALKIDPDDAMSMAYLSRLLASVPVDELRDTDRAVRLAERALMLTGGDDPFLLRVLAAAQAAAGLRVPAIETAERALERAKETGTPTAPYEADLRRYNNMR